MPRPAKGSFRSEVIHAREIEEPHGLVASARNYTKEPLAATGRLNRVRQEDWQKLAWEFYDTVTEYHYSVSIVANLMSRAKLYVTKDGVRTEDPKAVALLNAFGGGPEGQTELLRQYGIHFTVAGDSYLIGMERNGEDEWFIAAASEMSEREGVWKVGEEELQSGDLVIRAWRAHPQKRHLPDSPTRAALPVLAEIDGLTKHNAATIDSRLASAGILFVPNEMNIGAPPKATTPIVGETIPEIEPVDAPLATPTGASELMSELIETASASMEDRSSAAALVPIIVQVAGETIKDIKYITFWTELSEKAKDLLDNATRRLALGMDMPPEALEGTGDMNHWNSWQTEEAAIKSHGEPLLSAITSSVTEGYLRPMLQIADETGPALTSEDARAYAIAADTTEMRLRPNRSKEAQELHEKGALSIKAVVRENGFAEEDIMGDDEKKIWLLQKVASGSTTPELVAQALIAFGVPGITLQAGIPESVRISENPDGQTQEARPAPSIADHPTRDIPDTQDESDAVAAYITPAAFAIVDRALERAGNRIRQATQSRVLDGQGAEVSAAETYRYVKLDFSNGLLDRLLADAWGSCDRFAAAFDVDGEWLRTALDSYARGLLRFQRPHDAAALRSHLGGERKRHGAQRRAVRA